MQGNVTSPGMPAQVSGAPALASNALPIGTRIGEFEITRVIGEGGFSVVYLAFDHTLHRSIALKEYIPSALASRRGDQTVAVRSAQHQQTFEAGLRSFINESRLLAQFDHPALVKVYRFWEANGTAYMAMPHYEGRTLKEILREHPEQASQAWLKRLLVPLLDALALLHTHHCYHRDIAPDNIQILENGEPVLLDFGAARRTIGDMTQAFTVILKPGYAPIEQYAEETDLKQGPWTDVYALSAVLHGAIVGKPPPTAVARVIKDPLEPLAARGIAGFDQPFLAGIDRGLAVRPEARPQSIAEWRSLLGMDARPAAVRDVASDPSQARGIETSGEDRTRSGQRIDAANSLAATDDPEEEADRTVLVPGLRRSPPAAPRATPEPAKAATGTPQRIAAPPPARDARPFRDDAAKPMPWRPIALVAGIVVVAVVGWLLIARPFEPAAPPVVAKTGAVTTAPSPEGRPANPSQSSPSAPVPQSSSSTQSSPSPQTPPLQSSPKPPAQAAPPAQPQPTQPPPGQPTPAQALSPPESAPAPPPASNSEQPSSAAPGSEAAPKPRPPAIAEDERRWAALRSTDNIDDLRAFRHRFPQSRYAQEAAVRIQQLMRQSRENARETASTAKPAASPTPPVAKSAQPQERPRTEPATGAAAAGAAAASKASGASGAAGASTGTVHIRVQPFGYVYVDGALVGPSPPSRELQLSPGRHHIEARNDQENPPVIRREIDVTASGSTEVPLRFRE